MKVLHLIARMNVGGTSRYISLLNRGLNQNGIESSIATGFVQGAEVEDPEISEIKLHRIKHLGRAINPIADIRAMQEFHKLVSEIKPDIIHSHTFKAGFIARIKKNSLISAAGKEIRFVHTFHGHLLDDPEFNGIRKNIIIFIERYLAKKSNKLVTVGIKVSKDLIDNKIGDSNQYVNIPPGVFPLEEIDKTDAREKLGLLKNGKVIGWLARVTGVKNPLLAAEVANEFPDVQFIFGGSGDQLDVLKSSIDKNSKVLGWVDATTFISACDIIFSTSENEGMPIALIEAQLAGKPVVATNVGSVEEVVIDGMTGFLSSKSKFEMALKLKQLLSNQELAEKMSKNAKNYANVHFSPNAMVQSHINLYNNI